jgi:regulation of enolase protein 1 (concanavalin A-like superfamily)
MRLSIGAVMLGVAMLTASPGFAQVAALPSGWANADIGSPVLSGSTTHDGDSFTLRGGGAGIHSTADKFQFAYRTFTGDIDMIVRVADLQTTTGQGGLMIRESLSANAPTVIVALRAAGNVAFQVRARAGRKMSIEVTPAASTAVWLRLVRTGKTFRAYSSREGATWTLLTSATITMNATALIGLAVSSHDESQLASARFSSSVSGSPAPPPAVPVPWATSDVGSPSTAGSASAASGVFTVSGTGWDIWDTMDQFRFVYQRVTGDTQIVARVATLEAAHAWAKGGVMIRSALTGGASHASLFATKANGWSFQRRMYDDGLSESTSKGGVAPGWVRLVREGQFISAYHSSDGSNWTLVGTETVQMQDAVYIGFAVTSHDPAATAVGTFSNAVVSVPSHTNTPPTVSITAPGAGANFTAPASIVISAAASDSDGSVGEVTFFANGVLIGTATAAPFSISWPNVVAGSYSLVAVARDNEGATNTSHGVAITVASAPAPVLTSHVAFTPPVDYALNVTSVEVQLRRATDPVSAAPVATRNLGKPTSNGSDVFVDISTLVDPLPAGSYYAIVVATGPGGAAASAPSPAFAK